MGWRAIGGGNVDLDRLFGLVWFVGVWAFVSDW